MKKSIIKSLMIAAIIAICAVPITIVNYKPGKSYPQDEYERRLELSRQGYSIEEIDRICAQEFPQYYVQYDGNLDLSTAEGVKEFLKGYTSGQIVENTDGTFSDKKSSGSSSSSSASQTPQAAATETEKVTEAAPAKPAKTYSHDFDMLSDEARENFIHFSSDGVADSMYLNIATESAMNTITGKELNATTAGAETGIINYVSTDDTVQRSWIFENWQSEDDYVLDLTAMLEPYESEDVVGAYRLSLQDITLPEGNTVTLKVKSPYAAGVEVKLFTDTNNEYKECGSVTVSEDGYTTLTFSEAIVSYVMSPEDLIPVNAAEETVKTTDKAEAETEASVETAQTEETTEIVAATEPQTVPVEEPSDTEAKTKQTFIPYIVGAGIFVIAVIAGVLLFKKKK